MSAETNQNDTFKKIFSFVLSSSLGFLSITSVSFIEGINSNGVSFFSMVKTGIERLSLLTLVLLFVSGFFASLIYTKHSSRSQLNLLGFSTVAFLLAVTIADMIIHKSGHKLWPLEFLVYSFLAIIGISGARIGGWLKSRFK